MTMRVLGHLIQEAEQHIPFLLRKLKGLRTTCGNDRKRLMR